jgi:hypothetical protein
MYTFLLKKVLTFRGGPMGKFKYLIIALLAMSLVGCFGPFGPKPIIPDNPVNPDPGPGIIAARLLTGDAPPTATLGSNGDLYLDKKQAILYVKEAGTWLDVAALQGPAGTPGTIWLVGEVEPDQEEGLDGDMYLDTGASSIYLKKDGQWLEIANILEGKSAYQIWLELGNSGTTADFIVSLVGAQGSAGATGAPGANGTNGIDGKSAYQIWLNLENEGDEAAFIASLVGAKGDNGENGIDGKSAYQIWLDLENEGDEAAFIASLVGAKGDNGENGIDGKSAYQIWLDLENEGDEAAFIASLVGAKGDNGENGIDGKSAYQIWLDLENEGDEAVFIASLVGAKGDNGENGIDGKSAYQIWLDLENEGDEAAFIASLVGAQGAAGKSAYQIWLDLGNTGTETDFMNYLRGVTDSGVGIAKITPPTLPQALSFVIRGIFDGRNWHFGNGSPEDIDGFILGDIYVDLESGILWELVSDGPESYDWNVLGIPMEDYINNQLVESEILQEAGLYPLGYDGGGIYGFPSIFAVDPISVATQYSWIFNGQVVSTNRFWVPRSDQQFQITNWLTIKVKTEDGRTWSSKPICFLVSYSGGY